MLAGELADYIPGCGAGDAARAAHLAKADLVSEMVYEFPELQGAMGRYYALHDGEDALSLTPSPNTIRPSDLATIARPRRSRWR